VGREISHLQIKRLKQHRPIPVLVKGSSRKWGVNAGVGGRDGDNPVEEETYKLHLPIYGHE